MIYCTKCGAKHQDDDKFCRKCGIPLSKDADPDGKKYIYISRSLAKRCLSENWDMLLKHQEWCKKTYNEYEIHKYFYRAKHVVWIQFDPATGAYERVVVPSLGYPDPDDDYLTVDQRVSKTKELLSKTIRPGWNYCQLMVPTAEWQIEAYLDSPEDQSELGPTTPAMGGYQVRFV